MEKPVVRRLTMRPARAQQWSPIARAPLRPSWDACIVLHFAAPTHRQRHAAIASSLVAATLLRARHARCGRHGTPAAATSSARGALITRRRGASRCSYAARRGTTPHHSSPRWTARATRAPPPPESRGPSTPSTQQYAVLGVARGLTDRDYKVAYLRKAKEWHPDLRPNDPTATKKFHGDSGRARGLRARARFQDTDPGYGRPRRKPAQQSAAQAAATWAEAWADAGALPEAAQACEEECAALDEDVEFSAAVRHRRLGDALDVVKRRRSGSS